MKTTWADWIFACALHVLPRNFREEYGADMHRTFRSRQDAARTRGRFVHRVFLLRELG